MKREYRMDPAVVALLALGLLVSFLPAMAGEAEGVVNVNTAGADELALLPRVGPALAQRIIDFREENGSFKSAEELMLVRGIGERTYQILKPYVALQGKTTLMEKVRASQASRSTQED
jgi:comEA protein